MPAVFSLMETVRGVSVLGRFCATTHEAISNRMNAVVVSLMMLSVESSFDGPRALLTIIRPRASQFINQNCIFAAGFGFAAKVRGVIESVSTGSGSDRIKAHPQSKLR